jgi:hypothetical protein
LDKRGVESHKLSRLKIQVLASIMTFFFHSFHPRVCVCVCVYKLK